MPKDNLVYVGHMLDMARQARQLVAGKTRADYDADIVLRLALAHLVQSVGEAARRVSPVPTWRRRPFRRGDGATFARSLVVP